MAPTLFFCIFVLRGTARLIPATSNDTSFRVPPAVILNNTAYLPENLFWKTDSTDDDSLTPDARWCRYISRGTSLMKAMMMDETAARAELAWPYVQSPWDGDMRSELRRWGYLDTEVLHSNHDGDCDFEVKHQLGSAFRGVDGLGVDPRSAGKGGPNRCFYVQHSDSEAMLRVEGGDMPDVTQQKYVVDGVEYRATDAHAGIGVNPQDGLLYFLDRTSAQEAAKELWGRKPAPTELPQLRSTSDIAFGFWNRVATVETRTNLKYIMSCQILNEHTEEVIERALEAMGVDNIRAWPGTDLNFALAEGKERETEAALALLGSPNGIAAGYFLIQHKQQLDWKYTWKVKVFSSDDYPYILFHVTDQAPWKGLVEDVGSRLEQAQEKSRRKSGKDLTVKSRRRSSVNLRFGSRL